MELKTLTFHTTAQAQTENFFYYLLLSCKLNYVMRPQLPVGVGGALEILFVVYCSAGSKLFIPWLRNHHIHLLLLHGFLCLRNTTTQHRPLSAYALVLVVSRPTSDLRSARLSAHVWSLINQ